MPNMNSSDSPILVTGVPGRVGGVGTAIVEMLRRRDLPVRALALQEDARTDALRAIGVEVVAGDLTKPRDVARIDARRSTSSRSSDEFRERARWMASLAPKGLSTRSAIVISSEPHQFGLARDGRHPS
jgi:NAD(P)-dependent dehydrogenase (short-subunit alcohol dehydrogenase family)